MQSVDNGDGHRTRQLSLYSPCLEDGKGWADESICHDKKLVWRLNKLVLEKVPSEGSLKTPTSAFTFKTLLRHYAKWALTPRSLNVKLGLRCKGHKGQAVWL